MNNDRHSWLRVSGFLGPDDRQRGIVLSTSSCLAAVALLASLIVGATFAHDFGGGNGSGVNKPPHHGGPHGVGQGTGSVDDGSWLKAEELYRARNIAVGLIREMAIVDQFPPAVYIQFKEVYLGWAFIASQADVEPIPFDEWLWQVGIEDPQVYKALMTFFVVTELVVDKLLDD